ncbi:MAG: hypothetical protein E5V25_10105 [Mesorhizobium sp.]|nr:MAG: hypothetical protein E5W09_01345 [Mesorhizobium sp.]TIX70367.1 MAG: hypothetical protein E5V25_10105 [Mesorhizobium sp.]
MARSSQPLGVNPQQILHRRDACGQAEALEACFQSLASLLNFLPDINNPFLLCFLMALLSFVESAPRAYWPKVGNAALSGSRATGTPWIHSQDDLTTFSLPRIVTSQ